MLSLNRQQLVPWALFLGIFVCALIIAFWGLAGEPVLAEKGDDSAPAAEILARVGETEITAREVEERVAAEMVRIASQRYQALQQGLNNAVSDRLIELEAAARDMTVEELIEVEVDANVAEISQAEVDAFYEGRKDQMRASKEQVAEQIKKYLRQQRSSKLRQTMIATLEGKYGVERYLLPPRIAVASEGYPHKGPADAPVTIVEFSDFECPYCSRVLPSLDQVMENYGDSVRLVFRQFPLNSIHPRAQKAAEASLCANDQGKFWEMHDAMFDEQKSLGVDQLKEKAARLGLDTEQFNSCLDGDDFAPEVAADVAAGAAAGVTGTPAMFLNGRFVNGAVPYEQLAEIVDEELARDRGK
ncbi:MAG: thioredoxin domain-containing protein [Acidobacteria bacterium]|nr:thioredoxin domain-containing protein [Acidobacteriota bacterium]